MIKNIALYIKKLPLSFKEGIDGFRERFSKKMRENPQKDFFVDDELEFKLAFHSFFELIQRVKPPHVMGLYGGWGAGKTKMICSLIEILEHSKNKSLYFDAWECRDDNRLASALIMNLCEKYKIWDGKVLFIRVFLILVLIFVVGLSAWALYKAGDQNWIKALSLLLTFGAGASLAFLNFLSTFFSLRQQIVSFFSLQSLSAPTSSKDVSKAKKNFQRIINKIINKRTNHKLIIFIDNLDRCLPDRVVPLIEDIANYFRAENCVFILAMDKHHVIKAIQNEHPGFDGNMYLEKIVQTGLEMPTAKAGKAAGYFKAKFRESYSNYFGASAQDEVVNMLHSPIECLFSLSFLSNPRRIELFARKMVFLYRLSRLDSDARIFLALILIILKEQFSSVYEVCRQNGPSAIGKLLQLITWSSQGEMEPEHLRKQESRAQPNLYFPEFRNEYMGNRHFYDFLRKCETYRRQKEMQEGSPAGKQLLDSSADILGLVEII